MYKSLRWLISETSPVMEIQFHFIFFGVAREL